jgi:hypothetical protein
MIFGAQVMKTLTAAKTKPRASGALSCWMTSCSERAAAASTPRESGATAAAGRHHNRPLDHHRSRYDHDAIGPAVAIGTAVHTGAASAFGIRGAKARDRTGD